MLLFPRFMEGSWSPFQVALIHVTGNTVKIKVKADIALHGNPVLELRNVTCHMGSHSVTCQPTQVNTPRLTPAMQAGTRFTNPGGMEGWVDLVDLKVPRPEVETVTFRSWVRRWTAAPPRPQIQVLLYCTVCLLTTYTFLLPKGTAELL